MAESGADRFAARVAEVKAGRPHGVLLTRYDSNHALRMHGELIYVIHYEGVSRRISPDGFFTGFFLDETFHWTYADMKAKLIDTSNERIDLADFIKVFGTRCEVNFHQHYSLFSGDYDA
jgi:hypothetical protein